MPTGIAQFFRNKMFECVLIIWGRRYCSLVQEVGTIRYWWLLLILNCVVNANFGGVTSIFTFIMVTVIQRTTLCRCLQMFTPPQMAPGRFAQKPIPPGTIRLGRFAQNFERDCSHKITGTVRAKFNLLGQFSLFNFQKRKKNEVEFSSFFFFFFFFLNE